MDLNRLIRALHFSRLFWGVCGVLLMLNLLFYGFFVKDQRNRIREMEKTYMAKRAMTLQKENGSARFLKVKGDLDLFKERLTPRADFSDKIKVLNQLLDDHGLPVKGMTYTPASQAEGPLALWKYTSSFSVTGNYGQLRRLLADIQNAEALFCIEGLSFEGPSKDRADVEMKLKIASYFM
jgi:type IV pilus assembly protein PilO